jgi:hypothetical protein
VFAPIAIWNYHTQKECFARSKDAPIVGQRCSGKVHMLIKPLWYSQKRLLIGASGVLKQQTSGQTRFLARSYVDVVIHGQAIV